MQPLEISIGGILILLAVIAFILMFVEETVIALGVTVIAGALGGFLLDYGIHGEHAKFHAKHLAILRDITRQGFKVPYEHVFAVGGNFLTGTEVDIPSGSCQWNFIARKLDGLWRVALPRPNGNGVTVLSPADVKKLAPVCGAR